MNITRLTYFHAVVAHRTVSKAAEHLYISQPSLSNAIRELERELGVSLFYRRHNGMFLSPAGTKLYNATKELLSKYEEACHVMRTIGKEADQVRLGIPPMLASLIFADIYKGFVLENPEIELSITEKGKYELLDGLNDGLLDVVLLPHTKPFDKDLSASRIGTLEIVCTLPRQSPLACERAISAKSLDGYPLVLFSESFFQTKAVKSWFKEAGVLPTVSVRTEQITTAMSMIENGYAAAFAFRRFTEKNPALVSRPLSPPIFVDVSVLRKKDTYATEGIKKLERFLTDSELLG